MHFTSISLKQLSRELMHQCMHVYLYACTGVSLAELSSVEDVGFAFRRAKSRLKEMRGTSFLNNTKHVVNPW